MTGPALRFRYPHTHLTENILFCHDRYIHTLPFDEGDGITIDKNSCVLSLFEYFLAVIMPLKNDQALS